MSLQELKEKVLKLSVSDRFTLVTLIIQSLESELSNQIHQNKACIPTNSLRGRLGTIEKMRGFLKKNKPAPTDAEVQVMLEKRFDKYLQ